MQPLNSNVSIDEYISSVVAEDDHLRSRYMRRLIQEAGTYMRQSAASLIPRVLVQFWDDAKAIPADVRECMDSWGPLEEQGFQRFLFDDDSAGRFIAECFGHRHLAAFEQCRHPAMRSDYFRLCFILRKGGFYVDADDAYQGGDCESWFGDNGLKLQPLCYDISSDSMVDTANFLINPRDSSDLIFYVNNNPLIAPPGHPVIRIALERATKMLLAQLGDIQDIQSITGPGNLTASLVLHAIESKHAGEAHNFTLLPNWNAVAVSRWPLEYRGDERNWRLWVNRNV